MDYYKILGISEDAVSADIRKAYKALASKYHPDRYDQVNNEEGWKAANAKMVAINEAYNVLIKPVERQKYDRLRKPKPQQQRTYSSGSTAQSTPSPEQQYQQHRHQPDTVEITSGFSFFKDLPKEIQNLLKERQNKRNTGQIRINMESTAFEYIVGIGGGVWFYAYFYLADIGEFDVYSEFTVWMSIIATGAVVYSMFQLLRYKLSKVGHFVYITPLYLIKTFYDQVFYWPLWDIKDIVGRHYTKDGSYDHSEMRIVLPRAVVKVTTGSQGKADRFIDAFNQFARMFEFAQQKNDMNYVDKNNDFKNIKSGKPIYSLWQHRGLVLISLLTPLVLGSSAYFGISEYVKGKTRYMTPAKSQTRSLSHLKDPVFGYEPSHLAKLTPKKVVVPKKTRPLPYNGKTFYRSHKRAIAPLKIQTGDYGVHYYVKVINAATKRPVRKFFIRNGWKVSVKVPLGSYEVRYATGKKWYGEKLLFGPNTRFMKVDKVLTFYRQGNRVNGFTIELILQRHGNLRTNSMNASEW